MCSAFLINDVIIKTVRYIQNQSINKDFVKDRFVHDMYYIIKLNKQIKLMNNKSNFHYFGRKEG